MRFCNGLDILFYIIISILLIGVSYWANSKFTQLQKNNSILKQNNNILEEIEDSILLSQYENWLVTSGNIKDCVVFSRNNNSFSISQLNLEHKIIFYMAADMCQECVKKQFNNLKSLSQIIGYNNVYIFCSGYRKDFFKKASLYKEWNNVFLVENDIFTHSNALQTPTYAYIDNNRTIKYAYCSIKITNQTFELFLELIKQINK